MQPDNKYFSSENHGMQENGMPQYPPNNQDYYNSQYNNMQMRHPGPSVNYNYGRGTENHFHENRHRVQNGPNLGHANSPITDVGQNHRSGYVAQEGGYPGPNQNNIHMNMNPNYVNQPPQNVPMMSNQNMNMRMPAREAMPADYQNRQYVYGNPSYQKNESFDKPQGGMSEMPQQFYQNQFNYHEQERQMNMPPPEQGNIQLQKNNTPMQQMQGPPRPYMQQYPPQNQYYQQGNVRNNMKNAYPPTPSHNPVAMNGQYGPNRQLRHGMLYRPQMGNAIFQQPQLYAQKSELEEQIPKIESVTKPPIALDENSKPSFQQVGQLSAQVEAFRSLSRNMPISEKHRVRMKESKTDQEEEKAKALEDKLAINPIEILKERDVRVNNRISLRIKEIRDILDVVPEQLKVKLLIELRCLRLLPFQKQLRSDVVTKMRKDTTMVTLLNPKSYRRIKRQTLREARITEKIEILQEIEANRKKKQKQQDFIASVTAYYKEFRDFHKNKYSKLSKLNKALNLHFANSEREQKREKERMEKERMRRLMAEDEDGYRKLIDQQKDKRLAYLLQQTDDYIVNLTKLVAQHKLHAIQENEKYNKLSNANAVPTPNDLTEESSSQSTSSDPRIRVINQQTGLVLEGVAAPRESELEAWLVDNREFDIAPRDLQNKEDVKNETVSVIEAKDLQNIIASCDGKDQNTEQVLSKAYKEDDDYVSTNQNYYMIAHSIKQKIDCQPKTLRGGTLKPYQVSGLEWLVSLYNNKLNGILADEMGLGKTIQTIALLCYLVEVKKNYGPYLIIVPLSTLSNWDFELEKWFPTCEKIIYKGNPATRRSLQATIRAGRFNVLLTTYDYVMRDKAALAKIRWKHMIIDEGHRMKNHHCKLTQVLNSYYTTTNRLLLTGTPLQNKLPELWALLTFLLPSIFKSCATFEQWFNAPFAATGEKMELNQEETLLIIRRLHKVLRPFLLRRLKKEVESMLPDKIEYVIKCDMSAIQKTIYRHMQKRGIMLTDDSEKVKKGIMSTRALMNTIMQLRKICNHPFLYNHIEEAMYKKANLPIGIDCPMIFRSAGKFELIDRILPKLKATNHKVLMFCQMTNLMTILEDYFMFKGYLYLRLDGSTKADDRGDLLTSFNASDSEYFIFLLSTRAGGLGLNLQTADTVIIFDSDWNPHQDLQAQDRAHRIGQKNEVRVLRLMTINSVEEKILAAARYKLNLDEKVIQAGMFDQKSTNAERRELLKKILTADELDGQEECELPDDETINQMLSRSEEEFEIFQKIDENRIQLEKDEGQYTSRLVENSEIPAWLMKNDAEVEKMTQDDERGRLFARGDRIHKQVDYADIMTEKQWINAVEDGNLDQVEQEMKNQRDADGRKIRKSVNDDFKPSPTDQVEKPPRKRGCRASYMKMKDFSSSQKRMKNLLKVILNYIDSDGRVLSEPFMMVPPKKDLPDYYQVVSVPIDFKTIKRRIHENFYGTIDDLENDIMLLCQNAQTYNMEGSLIYEDSIVLQTVFVNAREKFDTANLSSDSATSTPSQDEYESDASYKEKPKVTTPRTGKKRGRKPKVVKEENLDA